MTQGTASTRPKKLDDLPPLVLLCVGDFLCLPNLACLAISSKKLHNTFGRKYQACLAGSGPEYFAFAHYYASDLPDHFHCQSCNALHSNAVVPLPGTATSSSTVSMASTRTCTRASQNHDLTPGAVTFPQIQVAMKNLKFGPPHGIPLSAFAFSENKDLARLDGHGFKFSAVNSCEARIFNGENIVRTQRWMRLPCDYATANQYMSIIKYLRGTFHDVLSPDSCLLHDYMMDAERQAEDLKTLRNFEKPWLRGPKTAFWAASPFVFDSSTVHIARKHNAAVSLTTWINYGDGFTPKNVDGFKVATAADRDNFESLPGETSEEMTERNEKLLFEKEVLEHWWLV